MAAPSNVVVREVATALTRAQIPAVARGDSLVVGDAVVRVEVTTLAVVTPAIARGLPAPAEGAVAIVVADRISADARRELAARGWGWVDRRGHVRLWSPGVHVATQFEPEHSASADDRFASVFPPVGVEVALALLAAPERSWSVADLAASIGRAAGGVSERLRALRDAGLVDRRNRPIVPDLFWELVGPWHQRPTGLAAFPGLDGPFDQLSWLGLPTDWVLTDTQAALVLGAPVIASGEGPPDFYVPQTSIVDAAAAHFGSTRAQPAATVRAIRFAGVHRPEPFSRTASGLQIAHPVVVALDLAHDRSRGREIVEGWDPSPLGVTRVW